MSSGESLFDTDTMPKYSVSLNSFGSMQMESDDDDDNAADAIASSLKQVRVFGGPSPLPLPDAFQEGNACLTQFASP